jgi:hypothetical protein
MKSITYKQAYERLDNSGNLKRVAVSETLSNSLGYYELVLEDKETLFHLLYQSNPHHKILTPLKNYKNHHYILGDVVDRMIEKKWTFNDLAKKSIPGEYNPVFFEHCIPIYESFNPNKAHNIVLRPFSDRSRHFCPNALFYIEDGGHRSLVYAYLLKTNQIPFTPIQTILCLPKQNKSMLETLKIYL